MNRETEKRRRAPGQMWTGSGEDVGRNARGSVPAAEGTRSKSRVDVDVDVGVDVDVDVNRAMFEVQGDAWMDPDALD